MKSLKHLKHAPVLLVSALAVFLSIQTACTAPEERDDAMAEDALLSGYGHYGHYGHYGNYGRYGTDGRYGNHGRYGYGGYGTYGRR